MEDTSNDHEDGMSHEEEESESDSPEASNDKDDNDEEEEGNNNNDENQNENGASASKSKANSSSSTSKGTPKQPNNAKSKAASPSAPRGTSKTYIELVHESIVELKDRTGSSQPAIMKYLISKYPNLQTTSPNNRFKSLVLAALKSGVKSGRFIKIKASWKVNSEWKKKQAAAQKRKKLQELKKKKELQKQKEELQAKDPLQAKIEVLKVKDPDSAEVKNLIAERKQKEEAEARKKLIAERLRKRRFPMEDTKLHAEDKELGVKPPKEVVPRPNLPVFFSLTQHDDRRSNNNKAVAAASRCDGLDKGNRGLVSDLLQVYHFFRGDVHYVGAGQATSGREIIPEFSLKHLIHAVDDVLNGNAKKSRMVPPLIVHLFVTCLQMLTEPPEADSNEEFSPQRKQLQQDFATHLHPALSPTSWADICQLYMDAMDRHYKTEASAGEGIILKGLPIDADFLLGLRDEELVMEPPELPDGYLGFLGHEESALHRGHTKLNIEDPWKLTAEELMALLRALTDEVLAMKPEISEDISHREEKMYELLKAKRAADAKLRKVRLAFEGPKKPPPKKPTAENGAENAGNEDDKRKSLDSIGGQETNGHEEGDKETEWKPTATKKQFEAAQKAQHKASDAYEKGVRKLMARTEPVGRDRHFNAVYCFRHDPEVLYVEVVKPSPNPGSIPDDWRNKRFSWHVIETRSMFELFDKSLDQRGKRERDLHYELAGEQGAQQSLKRFLFDDVKERAEIAAQMKAKEDLLRRRKNAEIKCAEEEGRRSGRLAIRLEEEREQIQEEINQLEQKIKTGTVVKEFDYEELSGLTMLRKYDSAGTMETRRTREKKVAATVNNFQSMQCSKLCSTGNIDGTGLMGMLVSKLLELEELCESLVPWERERVVRQSWISDLESLVVGWNAACPLLIGPPDPSVQPASPPSMDHEPQPVSIVSDTSRAGKRRVSSIGSVSSKKAKIEVDSTQSSLLSVPQAIAKLKAPLLDLEKRVYEITGLAMAAKDEADADDNISTNEEEEAAEKESKEKQAWKKLVNKLHWIPSKRHTSIREIVVDAIAAARKAQQKVVVGQLRAALLEFHPQAAGACKSAALKVLENHGGYDADSYDDDDEEAEDEENAGDETAERAKSELPSALSSTAVIMNSSLDGIEDSDHVEWVGMVKDTKTLSRMASLITAFEKRAKEKLTKVQEERDALMHAIATWEKEEDRRLRSVAKKGEASATKPSAIEGDLEVWANVEFTDEIVLALVEPYPWWPGKKCIAKDADLEASLKSVNRSLVALFGEKGSLRVVETSKIRPFTGKLGQEEDAADLSSLSKEHRIELDQARATARRLLRKKMSLVA